MNSTVTIPEYRVVDCPETGIGWVALEKWDAESGRYAHVAVFRSRVEAERYCEANLLEKGNA